MKFVKKAAESTAAPSLNNASVNLLPEESFFNSKFLKTFPFYFRL